MIQLGRDFSSIETAAAENVPVREQRPRLEVTNNLHKGNTAITCHMVKIWT